jgi:hypothetical protein
MSEIDRLAWLMREKSEMTDCPLTHEMCIPLVRCVLRGMREPTEAMIEAGRIAIVEYRENRREIMNSEFAELGYRSAIDAILNEKPK